MSTEVGAFEAKNRLSQLLAEAERGQRIYITRHGRRIAVLLRAEEADAGPSQATPDAVMERFRAFRKVARTGSESLRDLIEQGRR